MSRLDVLSEPLSGLMDEWLKAQGSPEHMQAFFKGVLGLPYEFEGSRLTKYALESAATAPAMDWSGGDSYSKEVVTAGIDVGAQLHVTVSVVTRDEHSHPVRSSRLIIAARSFAEVADILRRYRVDIAVVDSMPEMHKAQELRDEFIETGECEVWLCRFAPTARVGEQRYGMRLNHRTHLVQVDRTSVFDVSFADIREGRREFPIDVFAVDQWSDQMCTPVRVVDKQKTRIVWVSGNAPDHFRLSDVYDRVAADLMEAGGSFDVVGESGPMMDLPESRPERRPWGRRRR